MTPTRPARLSATVAMLALLVATGARAATMLDKACDFSNLNDKVAICDISNPNVTNTYGCWSMARGGRGAPSPRALQPGDVFGVQFFNPNANKRAYRVQGGPPLVFNASAASVDRDGLVEPGAPVAAAWEFLSAVLPRQKTMKEQAARVDAAAAGAVRRARLEGAARELAGAAGMAFQSGVSQVLADNPCWRADLALQPGERLVCALCFTRLSGPIESASFAPRALREGEAPREVVAEAPAGGAPAAGASSSSAGAARPATGGAAVAAAVAGAVVVLVAV